MARAVVLSCFVVGLVAACGGKAVVSQGGAGGAGGGTSSSSSGMGAGTTTSTTTSMGPGGGSCASSPPQGAVSFCGGTGSTGPGMLSCSSAACDQSGHQWETTCQGGGCTCALDGKIVCSCSLPPDQPACSGSGASCCPPPWPKP